MITERLSELVLAAVERAQSDGSVTLRERPTVDFERPRRREHGDWSTNVALRLAQAGDPRTVAESIRERLPGSDLVEKVEVAGPGFLNFYLSDRWLHDVVRHAADATSGFGRTSEGKGKKVNVEYVSSNPTGPVVVVAGRHAAVGDAIANLLDATGHEVTREFYVNDSGRQIDLFARSISARYLELHGKTAEIPEGGYRGDYVRDLAAEIAAELGDGLVAAGDEERDQMMREQGLRRMLDAARATLERFGTRFEVWFSETAMHMSSELETAVSRLREKGWVEQKEGASWFRSTEFGDDKDRVLIRANGNPTYLAADAAYLIDKFGRGFDHLVYIWGPDHHGTVARVLAAAEALGYARESVEIMIVQIVTLLESGATVKASKRAGVIVPLDELVAQVGPDAARYTFLTRSIDAPLDFDIDLAKEQAPENPVYYVQYAHARICSILKKAGTTAADVDVASASLERLEHPSELDLMRRLATYEEVVPEAAHARAPQKIARYVEDLAGGFSAFYRDCRVVSEDAELSRARLSLCVASKQVIADALGLLGVSAPESM